METTITLPTTPIQWTILIILLIAFSIQVIYYLFYIQSFKKLAEKEVNSTSEPVSIVICAKNEDRFLQDNLSFFLDQDYPEFEVIVVNDGSVDETEAIITQHQKQYSHLRRTKIPLDDKFSHNKKLAQTIGIKAAKNEKIVFSNISSKPNSKRWLTELMSTWNKGVHLGYSNFENKKGFFYNFLKFDILFNSIKGNGFASQGKPFSGNGSNLGYKKSEFFANKGFAKHSHFEAGYDHLMILQLGKQSGASACVHPDAKINLSTEKAISQWQQINRQYYKCRKYMPLKIRLFADIEPLSKFIFYLMLFITLLSTHLYFFAALVFLLRVIIIGCCFKIVTSHLKEENLFLSSYVYNIFVLISKTYFLCTNFIFSKSNRWK